MGKCNGLFLAPGLTSLEPLGSSFNSHLTMALSSQKPTLTLHYPQAFSSRKFPAREQCLHVPMVILTLKVQETLSLRMMAKGRRKETDSSCFIN